MISFGLTSASFSCTHFQDSERFQAFLSAVHSLVWFFGPSPQYSRLIPHPECLRRSYIVVPPVLGMCTKYTNPHSMSTAHLQTVCACVSQPNSHVAAHHPSLAIKLEAAYPSLQISGPVWPCTIFSFGGCGGEWGDGGGDGRVMGDGDGGAMVMAGAMGGREVRPRNTRASPRLVRRYFRARTAFSRR